jgi:uncharacterized protein (DUF302 family)
MAARALEARVVAQLLWPYQEGQLPMNALSAGQTYVVEERFDRAVKLVRCALETQELSVSGEFDFTDSVAPDSSKKPERSKLLLVDSPLLLFEALALDRAAGVFFPLHVLISADGDRTQVVCVEPASLFGVRLPTGSSQPLAALRNRIAMALESVVSRSDSRQRQPAGH